MKCCAIIYSGYYPKLDPGDLPPHFKPIEGMPVIAHTIRVFQECEQIDEIVPVVAPEFMLYMSDNIVDRYKFHKVQKIRESGETRYGTILSGLEGLGKDTDIVMIHDALRPFLDVDTVSKLITECLEHDAVALGRQAHQPVKRAEGGYILASLDRKRIYLMQSPQVFKYNLIMDAYRSAATTAHVFADDAAVVEYYGSKVRVVEGSSKNFRIESDADFEVAKYFIKKNMNARGSDV
ncbi:MAG TPA: 2-C-methyl-D-erythritol 4-phosphate cytidylyltransferase [candidate division Zixibacteria bacterium]|nr:2-C-methyl-D-erythritol 4-phosphate cytidylyltransferase [candidate division Zixibacteria bacterium]